MKEQLRQLIITNYIFRALGILPDEWYWADALYFDLYPEDDYSWAEIERDGK